MVGTLETDSVADAQKYRMLCPPGKEHHLADLQRRSRRDARKDETDMGDITVSKMGNTFPKDLCSFPIFLGLVFFTGRGRGCEVEGSFDLQAWAKKAKGKRKRV